jgi:DDE superfamily endonuclease
VTLIESISAAGDSHPPLIILKAASIMERWIIEELPESAVIAHSSSGYSNDDINLAWIKHFDRSTRARQYGTHRLLLLDGFTSHIEYDFVRYTKENQIILFALPPHTTHFLQPLDVVCFQPLKHYHAEAVDAAVRTGDMKFSKIEFLAALTNIRKQAFKKSTILSAFRKTGIIPFDPQQVIGPLQERFEATERARGVENRTQLYAEMDAEVGESSEEEPSTPTLHNIRGFGRDLLEALEEEECLPPRLFQQVSKLVRASTTLVDLHTQLQEDLQQTEAAQAARSARTKTTQRRVTGGGVITIEEARHRVDDRAEKEAELEAKRVKRRAKKEQKDTLRSREGSPMQE